MSKLITMIKIRGGGALLFNLNYVTETSVQMSFSVSMAPERFPKDSHNKYTIQVRETESLQVCIFWHKDNITIWSTLFVYGGNYLPSRVWSALFFSISKVP